MRIHNKTALLFLLLSSYSIARNQIEFKSETIQNMGTKVSIYTDFTSKLTANEVLLIDSFQLSKEEIPNLGISNFSHWVEVIILNSSNSENVILEINNPILDKIKLFGVINEQVTHPIEMGDQFLYSNRKFDHQKFLFHLKIPISEERKFLLNLKSWEQISLKISLGKPEKIYEATLIEDFIFGIYFGIIIALVLYNFFIFIIVRDRSYLYYVIFIFFIALTQATLYGYTFRFLWPFFPNFVNHTLIIFPAIGGIATCLFMTLFLRTKTYTPTLHKGIYLVVLLYFASMLAKLIGFNTLSFKLTDLNAMILTLYALILAISISIKGYRPAKLFLLAWSIFLVGIIFFVMRNTGVLPSNYFTNYTMLIGSALETILLSFALADRINIMKKEKEASQLRTVEVLKENEKIIKNQNIILEQKVEERTDKLNNTLNDLKQAQSQLVDAEKMSSLGLLTAGIAHEINNPINFVSSNILPLRQDIDDVNAILTKYEELKASDNIPEKLKEIENLKKELDYDYLKKELAEIIDGIEDGAIRTTEIVSGLKNFSRLDEGEFKLANFNDGIKSTFILVKNKLDGIQVNFDLGDIPFYECNPGKINQLILNLLDNAIYATKENNKDHTNGKIEVKTASNKDQITLSVSDNGIGISPENISKLFDPFFTTKDVGEGTGLGLSIVRGIIDSHNGIVNVESTEGKGTEIVITFPIKNI